MRPMTSTRLVAGALALAVAGAAPALAQEEPKNGGTLRFATQGDPNTFDCHAATSIAALQYLAPHYSMLIEFDGNNYPDIVGDLATDWTVADDGLTYTFILHEGVKFHDGSDLTAEDIRATFDRIANPPQGVVSARSGSYSKLETINVLSPTEVEFKLSAPSAGFLATLANPYNCVYSAAMLESDPRYPGETVMGSGPFVFEDYQAGAIWKGTRFDDYFIEGKPHVDAFEANLVSGPAVVNTIAGRQLDANFRLVSVPEMDRIREMRPDDVEFQTTPATSVSLLALNTQRPPFDDVRVRQALSLAIDRDQGIQALGDLAGQRSKNVLFRNGHALAPNDEEITEYIGFGPDIEANRAEARRLLEEAGVSDLSFTLLNRSIRIPYEPLAIFFIDQWRQIGVTVTQEALETGPWSQRLRSGDYEVGMDFNAPTSDDPSEVLIKYLPGSASNTTGIEDEELVDLYEQQDAATDPAERDEIVKRFVERYAELQYYIPSFTAERNVALDARVKNWTVPPSFAVGLHMRDVWLDE